MMDKKFAVLAGVAWVVLSGCSDNSTHGKVDAAMPSVSVTDPHALAQMELERASLELQRFVAVRIQDGERRLEASPISPAIVSDARMGDESFKTLFRVNQQGDTLILFTRDVYNARSHRTEIPLSELEKQRQFSFPVVQPDGTLKTREFQLVQIVRPE